MSSVSADPSPARVLAAVRNVHKRFGAVDALRDVTLEIRAGQVHCLLGENGAGKSTVVKLLSGVHRPDAGAVEVKGVSQSGSPRAALELGVSTIYQELTLVPDMTVAENIALGREPSRCLGTLRNRRQLVRDAREALDRLGVDGIDPAQTAGTLGIAQQQLVEIAKAVSRAEEQVLIMDEATAPLTPDEVDRLFAIIEGLRARGLGILYITHRLDEVPRIGTYATVMRDGQVVTAGPSDSFSKDQFVELMVGRKVETLYPTRVQPPGEVVAEIAADDGGEQRVSVRAGEVVALFGLVGAGRTELVRGLIGADRANGHRLLLQGTELRAASPAAALRQGVGLVPEDRKAHGIVPEMSVAANISLGSLRRVSRRGLLTTRRIDGFAAEWTDRLRVRTSSVRQRIGTLSGGNQQKCVIARVLAASPKLLVLDEPTRGIDVGARADLYGVVNQICAAGTGVLMITSDLPEALGMSDRIYVMRSSRIVGEVATESATERAVVGLAIGAEAESRSRGELT